MPTYNEGDKIQLKNQEVLVEKCKECNSLMVNLDANQLAPGDLTLLKQAGLVVSNPDTDKLVCIKCEYKSLGRKISEFFESDDDDDSSFFSSGSFGGGFRTGGGGGGFGGFGGFGGGGFGGAGATRGF